MTIKVLGPGCMNCKTLERRTLEALEGLQLQATVEKVEDFEKIVSYGIMRTPGLIIDEKIVSQGSVPTVEKIKQLILEQQKGRTVQ
ncbi:MAG: thioredoxin family protein [Ignavibacteriales bacterium]|nr:thioredoxin family protein [Ignavibacteriales bacterium]MBI3788818.1 thioredoxin family protein [Ignavibacteriales bacterium]